ncbi:MAG: Golgi phosphoprotein 3 [Frankiales bacterium]|jgi:uncharacterized membrane protein YgcG|nr:Golgi phosphoprotein 3 [Frankiales bacterium]
MAATLSGDVLLLAIGPRATFQTVGPVGLVLAGALLCESAMAGWPILPESNGPRRAKELTALVEGLAPAAVDRCAAPLEADGVIARLEHVTLRVFRRNGYQMIAWEPRQDAARRLVSALTPGRTPSRGEAVLAVLCATAGLAGHVMPPPAKRAGRVALAHHLNGLRPVVGEPVAEVLFATRRAYRRADANDWVFAPVDGSSGYGDHGGHGDAGHGGGHDGGGGHGGGGH